MIAWTLARRELRSGVRGLRIVLACLALGVGAIAAVGSLRAGIEAGLAADGRRLLGGDLDVQTGAEAPPEALLAWLRGRGGRVSQVVQMRSMLVAAGGERQLVELKAVDGAYPLVGAATLADGGGVAGGRCGRGGWWLSRSSWGGCRWGWGPGCGWGMRGWWRGGFLGDEPDRIGAPALLAPRAFIGIAGLAGTGLVQPGSLVSHAVRVVLPSGG